MSRRKTAVELGNDDKKKVERILPGIISYVSQDTFEVYGLKTDGVPGVATSVQNPIYDSGNGDGHERLDFPSFYQVEAVHDIYTKKRLLIADEMGVGKTAQGLAAKPHLESKLGRPVKTLVICPNSLMTSWYERILDPEKSYFTQEYRDGLNVVVLDTYTEAGVEQLKNADIAIVNYDKFSFSDEQGKPNNGNRKKIKQAIINAGFDYLVLDEVHNAKNANSRSSRSKHVKDIADNIEYLSLLSGTPIPNTFRDIYMTIALLEPSRIETEVVDGVEVKVKKGYATAKEVAEEYRHKPNLIGAILRNRMLRREMKDIETLPELRDGAELVDLGHEQQRVYDDIFGNNQLEGSRKLQLLKKVLLDPSLLKDEELEYLRPDTRSLVSGFRSEHGRSKYTPAKYHELDRIIEENVARGEKTVVFSPLFTKGVTRELRHRYRKYGAVYIDGKVKDTNKKKEREEAWKEKFQKDPDTKVIIASNVGGEGIHLTAANNIVFLDDPYSPGQRDQMKKRSHRRGQTKPVNVTTLAVRGTVDEGVIEFLADKQRIIKYIMDGARLTEDEKALLSDKRSIEEYLLRTKVGNLYTPQQYVHRMTWRMVGRPEEALKKAFEGETGKKYADSYTENFEESFQGNTAEVYRRIIQAIEEKQGKLDRKVDLASGPAVLSRVLNEPTFSLDLNKNCFETEFAKSNPHLKHPNNTDLSGSYAVGSLIDMPYKSRYMDLALCSLALHWMPNQEDQRVAKRGQEVLVRKDLRRSALKETNRVLKYGGYAVFALPAAVVEDSRRFEEGLKGFGFDVVPELTGFVKDSSNDVNYRGYFVVARKSGSVKDVSRDQVYLKSDTQIVCNDKTKAEIEKVSGEKKALRFSMRRRGKIEGFSYYDPTTGEEESMEERLERYYYAV